MKDRKKRYKQKRQRFSRTLKREGDFSYRGGKRKEKTTQGGSLDHQQIQAALRAQGEETSQRLGPLEEKLTRRITRKTESREHHKGQRPGGTDGHGSMFRERGEKESSLKKKPLTSLDKARRAKMDKR